MNRVNSILESIRNLNFDALNQLLDDNRSYMDVPKATFIKALKSQIQSEEKNGFTGFEKVLKGTCGSCNKGCTAYSFITKDLSLDLFFEMKGDEVIDIYLCHDFLHKDKINNNITFSFYEESKTNFVPSESYLYKKQRAYRAVDDFKYLTRNKHINIEDLEYWKEKYKDIVKRFGFNDPFVLEKYNGFIEFDELCYDVVSFLDFKYSTNSSSKALKEYHSIKSEKDLVQWLLNNKDIELHNVFERTDNWQKSGFIRLSENLDVIVDCSSCIDAFIFAELYSKEVFELMEKYKPTNEHYSKFGSIDYDLITNLKLHKKYLDILPIRYNDPFDFEFPKE